MALPVVAIVGRPNVGKSSLFNLLAGRRTAIVEPTAGVTRDRISTVCQLEQRYFELVDTGGYGVEDSDQLTEHVERQIQYALSQANVVLFVVDAREGINPLDRRTAELLRSCPAEIQLLANKVDEPHLGHTTGEFVALGYGEPLLVSALQGDGRSDLFERLTELLADSTGDAPTEPVMKVALVGKRNAGKSTFINALAGEERVIVSEVPGTTRDSVDVRFELAGQSFLAIDTAGVRRKNKLASDIEYYALTRAEKSIRRADVVLLLIDATVPVGQVDKRLSHLILEEYKPCVLVVNKWDLAKDRATTTEYGDYLSQILPGLEHAPVTFTTASGGRNLQSTIDVTQALFRQAQQRVATPKLNQVLRAAMDQRAPRPRRGQRAPKFYYATQVATRPPTIVVFVNAPHLVTANYERYLLNRLREQLPFEEIPIRLVFRARRDRTPTA